MLLISEDDLMHDLLLVGGRSIHRVKGEELLLLSIDVILLIGNLGRDRNFALVH